MSIPTKDQVREALETWVEEGGDAPSEDYEFLVPIIAVARAFVAGELLPGEPDYEAAADTLANIAHNRGWPAEHPNDYLAVVKPRCRCGFGPGIRNQRGGFGMSEDMRQRAIEAGAEAMYEADDAYRDTWDSQPEEGVRDWYRRMSSVMIDRVLDTLADNAEAWDDAAFAVEQGRGEMIGPLSYLDALRSPTSSKGEEE